MSDQKEKVTGAQLLKRSPEELAALLSGKRETLRQSKFKHALNQLRQTHILRTLRRDIAKLKTAQASLAATGTGAP
jgi:ribosomal protein L29